MLFHLNKSTFLASKLKIGFVNHTFSYRGVAIFFNKYRIAIYSKRPSQTTLCQKQSETLLKNRACHDWSGYNGVSLVSGPDKCRARRAYDCPCNSSSRDKLGFYAEIQIFLGQCTKHKRGSYGQNNYIFQLDVV